MSDSTGKRDDGEAISPGAFSFLNDVPVHVTVEIGRCSMTIGELLKLTPASIIELDTLVGESLDIFVNDRRIARGEAVVVGDHYGVRLIEILVNEEPDDGSEGAPR